MLLLGGNNLIDNCTSQLNWLSYTSTLVVEELQSRTHILAVFCQTDYVVNIGSRLSYPDIMGNLIYQLAKQHPSGLRH
jgi:hypothetical protein